MVSVRSSWSRTLRWNRLRIRTRLFAAMGALLALTSCDGLLGLDAEPSIYVLRTIDGAPLPVNLNDFIDDGTEQGEWTILADTLFFHGGGRGEWRGTIRFHAPLGFRPSPNPGPRIDRHRRAFSYEGDGRTVTLFHAPCEDVCLATFSRPEVVDRLRLRRRILREWTYERVRD